MEVPCEIYYEILLFTNDDLPSVKAVRLLNREAHKACAIYLEALLRRPVYFSHLPNRGWSWPTPARGDEAFRAVFQSRKEEDERVGRLPFGWEGDFTECVMFRASMRDYFELLHK
jgi:hypothetical protein